MAYASEILERLAAIDITDELGSIAKDKETNLADAVRAQLLQGRDSKGSYLPRYVDDPYFKSIAQAKGYEAYKAKISPGKNKPRAVKDYYINGYTHQSITATVSKDNYAIHADTPWAANMEAENALGINPDSAKQLWQDIFLPMLLQRISQLTGIGYTSSI